MPCQHPDCGCVTTPVLRDGRWYCSEGCGRLAVAPAPVDCSCSHDACRQPSRPAPDAVGDLHIFPHKPSEAPAERKGVVEPRASA